MLCPGGNPPTADKSFDRDGDDGFSFAGDAAFGVGADGRRLLSPRRQLSPRPYTTAAGAIPSVDRGASTIDALFAPIEVVETNGQVWLLSNDVLTPISVTLGASDGTSSELVNDQTTGRTLINGSILVTNITTPATSISRTTGGNTSPLMPQFPFGRRSRNNSGNRR